MKQSKVSMGKNLSDKFSCPKRFNQGDTLSPLYFNFTLGYAIRKFHENQANFKSNRTYQLLVYADDVNLMGDNILIDTIT
jgi:hypothetical protein